MKYPLISNCPKFFFDSQNVLSWYCANQDPNKSFKFLQTFKSYHNHLCFMLSMFYAFINGLFPYSGLSLLTWSSVSCAFTNWSSDVKGLLRLRSTLFWTTIHHAWCWVLAITIGQRHAASGCSFFSNPKCWSLGSDVINLSRLYWRSPWIFYQILSAA